MRTAEGAGAGLRGRRPLSPRAVILGCAGTALGEGERALFREADPLGFILFRRNCADPAQVRALTASLRETVGRDCPILIDQEGGRVQRLRAPHWHETPPAACLAARDPAPAAVELAFRLIGVQCAALGITVDCAPVLDLRRPETTEAIGDRALSGDAETTAALGRVASDGLLAGGVLPAIKHMPGHGRAAVDSHHRLPRVAAGRHELAAADFVPFRALRDAPWGMTAHIVFEDIDAVRPATWSPDVIGECIRGDIGFRGVLVSDDIAMNALSGPPAVRAERALAAGCDVALYGASAAADRAAVAAAAPPLTAAASARLERAEAMRRPAGGDADALAALLAAPGGD